MRTTFQDNSTPKITPISIKHKTRLSNNSSLNDTKPKPSHDFEFHKYPKAKTLILLQAHYKFSQFSQITPINIKYKSNDTTSKTVPRF